eukprot:g35413.t1
MDLLQFMSHWQQSSTAMRPSVMGPVYPGCGASIEAGARPLPPQGSDCEALRTVPERFRTDQLTGAGTVI